MVCKVLERFVQSWFIAAAFGHGCLQVMLYKGGGNASDKVQRILAGGNKVFHLLAHNSFYIGKLAGSEDGHKGLHCNNFTGILIGVAELSPAKST